MTDPLDRDYYATNPVIQTEPVTHARVAYANLVTSDNIIASSELAGFEADALASPDTFSFWKPSALPATATIDFGDVVTIDCVALGAHNLGGACLFVETSLDGLTFTTVRETVVVRDDAILLLFSPVAARFARVRVTGYAAGSLDLDFVNQIYQVADLTDPGNLRIGVLNFSECLQMERAIYGGHSPAVLSRNNSLRPTLSERGQFLGSAVTRQGYTVAAAWKNLTALWYRDNFDAFAAHVSSGRPFFLAWRPGSFADEAVYCWSGGNIRPANAGTRDLMSVDLQAVAHAPNGGVSSLVMSPDTFANLITFARSSTATYFDAAGILQEAAIDEARFDYDPNTLTPKGLLIEQQRTNLALYSQDFDSANWPTSSNTSTTSVTTTPFGTITNAAVFGDNSVVRYRYQQIILSTSTDYTVTVFIKMDDNLAPAFGSPSGSSNLNTFAFVLAGEPMASTTASVQSINSGDGVFKVVFNFTTLSAHASNNCGVVKYSSNDARTFKILAIQIEEGNIATSYTPTTNSQVTRSADLVDHPVGAEFNGESGTLFSEIYLVGTEPITFFNALGSDNTNRRIQFVRRSNGFLAAQMVIGGSVVGAVESPYVANSIHKFAASYSANGWVIAINGNTLSGGDNASGAVGPLHFGKSAVGTDTPDAFYQRSATYAPVAFSAAQLAELTT